MIDYSEFFTYLNTTELKDVAGRLKARTAAAMDAMSHGDFDRWAGAIEAMGDISPIEIDLGAATVRIGAAGELNSNEQAELRKHLMELHPWRKGPFEVFGVHLDTEWRSDLKWARLQHQIDLKDKLILDVGCGNGYYLFRMLAAGAKAVIGVDPFLLYVMQFHAINRFVQTRAASVLPLGTEDVPQDCECFDTVFSMGILYHRRDPKEHLEHLKGFLKPGGQLVLETIVLETEAEELLTPEGRYAKMRNVWTIASVSLLEKWLLECGFGNVRVLDIARTTHEEQRKTEWMTFESLGDFLDPEDNTQTIEGHPAPVRAVLVAQKR